MRVAADRLEVFLARLLDRTGCFQFLTEDAGEAWLWENHELASLVENRLGALVDPAALEDASRAELVRRVSAKQDSARGRGRRYWLLQGRRRIGTISIDLAPRTSTLEISSVYVVPRARRQGHAGRALQAIRSAAWRAGVDEVRLTTEWCWTPAVHLYQSLGMWLTRFDGSLELVWRRALPVFEVIVEGCNAEFRVGEGERRHVVLRAKRIGSHTEWQALGCANLLAPPTFALALAAQGWPLRDVAGAEGSGVDQVRALGLALERFEASRSFRGLP